MTKDPTYEELKEQVAELKKQLETFKLDLVENTNKRKQSEIDIENADIEINQFGTVLDNLDAYVYVKDTQRRYFYANKKTLNLFKCTTEELKGSVDSNFFSQQACEQLSQIDRRILELGEKTAFEVESKDSDGKRLVYWEVKTPIFDKKDKSKIVGLCGISTDITERKKAEDKIKASEIQLKKLNATKDKLFSIIAHDLRSPFNSIIGFSELLLSNVNNTENTQSEKYIDIINSTAKNTLILLDNLLNWAKSQTRDLSLRPETINLSKVIFEIFSIEKPIAKAKNISLNYSPPTNEIELYTDENLLKTVLRNLISNAIKFTNPNGNINVLTTIDHNQVEISISDNGVGISKDVICELFNISMNVISQGTANEKGSGLGLILCKEFVEKLNGKIWVESEVGKGSDFKFTLPLSILK